MPGRTTERALPDGGTSALRLRRQRLALTSPRQRSGGIRGTPASWPLPSPDRRRLSCRIRRYLVGARASPSTATLGFDVAINDDDDGQPPTANWSGTATAQATRTLDVRRLVLVGEACGAAAADGGPTGDADAPHGDGDESTSSRVRTAASGCDCHASPATPSWRSCGCSSGPGAYGEVCVRPPPPASSSAPFTGGVHLHDRHHAARKMQCRRHGSHPPLVGTEVGR